MDTAEHSLVSFLRRVLTADKARALLDRRFRGPEGAPCPQCGRDGTGIRYGKGGTIHVLHGLLTGCQITEEQYAAFGDDGLTDAALARIVDLDSKLAIVELCAPPLIDTTGPMDSEKTFIPGEGPPWGLPVLKQLAVPYAEEPEYKYQANRERWTP